VTGMHRKAAIRLLRRAPRPRRGPHALAARGATAPPSPRRPKSCGRRAAGSVPTGCIRLWANSSSGSSGAVNSRWPPRSRSSSGRRVARPSRGCWRPPALSSRRAGTPRPSPAPGSSTKSRSDLHGVGRRAPRLLRGGSRGPLWEQHQGFYLCTLCASTLRRPGWNSRPSGARVSSGSAPPSLRPRAPPGTASGARQRQRLGVHQPPSLHMVSARGHHLHAQPRYKKKTGPCRAEERRRRPAAHRL